MRYACLFVPNFPLQAATRLAKENASPDGGKLPLSQSALAILDGKPPWVTVIAVNEKAWRAGVDVGMTKLQAESCPSVILRHRGLAQEKAAQAALLDCTHAISPRVEAPRPDLVLLDLHGLASLYTSEENVASTLTRLVAEIGLQANVGVASNLEAAMHAARGFTGITLIPAGQEGERLGQLPVALLSPSQEILETLDHWGIRCFRELAALPTKALAERLGQEGVRLQRLARGKEQRLLVPIGPALEFEESVELDEPLEMLEPLSFCLNAMLLQLCARLAARSLATDRLDLTLYLAAHEDLQLQHPGEQTAEICGPPSQPGNSRSLHRRTLRLPVPMRDSRKLLKLLQLDLSSHPPPAPVQQVVLKAEPARLRPLQIGVLTPPTPEPEQLEVTLARVRNVVGDSAPSSQPSRVGSARLLDSHRPGAFGMAPFCPSVVTRPGITASRNPPCLALRVFRPPLATKVELRDAVPWRVLIYDLPMVGCWRGQVISASGPWQSSGDWWGTEPWVREEWDLRLDSEARNAWSQEYQGLYRVFRDLVRGDWYVEGVYD